MEGGELGDKRKKKGREREERRNVPVASQAAGST
jgi:hypothetical protein